VKIMSTAQAISLGYAKDKRKRRRAHRRNARRLLNDGGVFVGFPARRGTTQHSVAQWHLWQARNL